MLCVLEGRWGVLASLPVLLIYELLQPSQFTPSSSHHSQHFQSLHPPSPNPIPILFQSLHPPSPNPIPTLPIFLSPPPLGRCITEQIPFNLPLGQRPGRQQNQSTRHHHHHTSAWHAWRSQSLQQGEPRQATGLPAPLLPSADAAALPGQADLLAASVQDDQVC